MSSTNSYYLLSMAGDARQQAAPDETLAMFVSSIQSVIREQINKDLASYIEEVRSYEREGGGDGSLVAFAVGAFPRRLQRDTKWTRICSKVRHHVMRTFLASACVQRSHSLTLRSLPFVPSLLFVHQLRMDLMEDVARQVSSETKNMLESNLSASVKDVVGSMGLVSGSGIGTGNLEEVCKKIVEADGFEVVWNKIDKVSEDMKEIKMDVVGRVEEVENRCDSAS